MMASEIPDLLDSISLPDLISKYVALKHQGHEWVGLCPFHSEKSPSFTVFEGRKKQRFQCHGCGAGGDAIDFIGRIHDVDFKTAVAMLSDKTATIAPIVDKKAARKKPQRLTRPATREDGAPTMHTREWGEPTMAWAYRRPDGEPMFWVARYEWEDAGKRRKATPQWTMGSMDGGKTWRWGLGHYASPRPLYGLDRLAASPASTVIICEGEKATDAAQRLLPHFVAMTWAGGSKAVKYTDFSPLAGRDVILWPDADAANYPPEHSKAGELMPLVDQVGTICMTEIAGKLHSVARSVRLVQVPVEPDNAGWDAADIEEAKWTGEYVAQWIEDRAATWSSFVASSAKEIIANEDAIALAFAERYASTLQYCHDKNMWLEWNGNYWRPERKNLAFHYARELARIANTKGEKGTAKASTAAGAERFARADPRIATVSKDWDCDPWLLATPSGTVDLRTGELRDGRQSDRITRVTAVGPGDGCDTWNRFLEDATRSDGEFIDYLQRVSGYCLTGSVSAHALFFFYGDGGNGKGTFLNTLNDILWEYAKVAAMDMFMASQHDKHPTDLAYLQGARLVTAQETQEGRHWATTKVNALTGGDPITARVMRGDPFTFNPTFKILIAGNHKPALKSVDAAVRRRFHVIPFTHSPTVVDENLREKLKAEWPGILNWMIEGCLHWQMIGLSPPAVVRAATAEYFEDQNTFETWVAECCVTGANCEDTVSNLFQSWSKWCERNGEHPGSSKSFSQRLEKGGYPRIRTNQGRKFTAIAVVDNSSPRFGYSDDFDR